MSRFGKPALLALILLTAPAVALAASGAGRIAGTWRKLPPAPFALQPGATSVWTGKQLIVYGLTSNAQEGGAAFDPASGTWRRLPVPAENVSAMGHRAVWTGKEMLAFGAFASAAFDPAKNTWRSLRRWPAGGMVVWTGREAIGWGGGCCGDAHADGAAYDPRADRYRKLPRGPLAPSQGPVGAWDGHALLLFVSGFTPDGKRYPARFARAAAYVPATNIWKRIAPIPVRGLRSGGSAAWDGKELLVAGSGAKATVALAYNPRTNRWRRLAPLPVGRIGATAVWTGKALVLWGGQNVAATAPARDGLAYDPRSNRWSALPRSPLRARDAPTVAWTGRSLIVWGGEIGTPLGTSIPPKLLADGATFTPSARTMDATQGMCGG